MALSSMAGLFKWTPVYYKKAALMYKYADKAVEKFNKGVKIGTDRVQVCQVIRAAQINVGIKKFKLYVTVTKPICTRRAGNVCYHILEVKVSQKNKKKFKVEKVKISKETLSKYPSCYFPELEINKIIPK